MGGVVAYTPGQSITIVDQNGTQHQYTISSTLKILPPGRADSLTVGSFVTIIAPASLNHGKEIAVGIVVHPQIPNGWTVPSLSSTPVLPETPVGTSTETPVGTLVVTDTATETPLATATETVTGTQLATETSTDTPTATAMETSTDTPTPTATPMGGSSVTITTNGLIEWLRSLLQEILASR